ncbi:hypothetical protein [Streptomyces fungicidicus]|uniref:hypothetical protein n=1 Tax=Streptomyces fungicidicus TaxID=68203 RepID=UPI003824FF5D
MLRARTPRFSFAEPQGNEVDGLFTVLEYRQQPTPNQDGAFLTKDSWDDYGHVTTFDLQVRRQDGRLLHVGHVRIAHTDMETDPDFRATADRMPTRFGDRSVLWPGEQ